MKIGVVGTGYVGLVTSVVLADLGNSVIAVDKDPAKLEKLRNSEPTIYEPGLEEILRRTVAEGNLSFTSSVAEATRFSDVIFICVGTPPLEDGTPDLSAVRHVAAEIGKAIEKYTVVVNKSTVPVGSGDLVSRILSEQGVSSDLYDVVSNPEFLREGSAIHDTLEPDRIVIGAKSKAAAQRLIELYAPLERPMHITDVNSAELIKYASNAFLATKISFINAISRLCELCGADVGDVSKGMGSDARIGHAFLQAGLGWGGSCFPKDVHGLEKVAESLGYEFGLLREVWEVNRDQTVHAVRRVEQYLGGLSGKRIGLLGLAFKPNTDDIRDARSLVIIEELLNRGASVVAYDPVASSHVEELYPQVEYARSAYQVAEGSDALMLVTEWNEFKQLDLGRLAGAMRGNLLFDGRRIYKPDLVKRAGLELLAVGLGNQIPSGELPANLFVSQA